jgi:Flp pilus assembly pilin Flp
MKILRKLQRLLKNEKGQTMIEYALVVVLIAIVLVFLFLNTGVKSGISGAGSRTASALNSN